MQPKDPTFTRSDPWKFDTRVSPNQLRTLPIKSKARTVQSVHPKRILETSNLAQTSVRVMKYLKENDLVVTQPGNFFGDFLLSGIFKNQNQHYFIDWY
jgi:hypothetical protein